MTDIVERLRDPISMSMFRRKDDMIGYLLAIRGESSDEIERLRLSLSETEDNTLLSYLADIRQKSGVGIKPMLSELADAIASALSEARATGRREGMEKAARIAESTIHSDEAPSTWLSASDADARSRFVAAAIRAAMEKE